MCKTGRKKDHHFTPITWQKIFYQFKPTKHGFYYDLRYEEFDYRGTPKTRMWLMDGYSIYDASEQLSDEIENVFEIVENDCAPVLREYIKLIQQRKNVYFPDIVNIKLYFFFTLQILRMPHVLYEIYNEAENYARIFVDFVLTTQSLEYCNLNINQYLEEQGYKQDPPLIMKSYEYNEFKTSSFQNEKTLNKFYSCFSKNNHLHNFGKLICVDGIKELFSIKKETEFVKRFDELYHQSRDSNHRSKHNIAFLKIALILNQTIETIIVTDEPSFIFPMAVLPDNIDNSFHVPISPTIVVKFNGKPKIATKLEMRHANNQEIKDINKEFIERTKLLKDCKHPKDSSKYLYQKLSICIPCECNDFNTFKEKYFPKDIVLKA